MELLDKGMMHTSKIKQIKVYILLSLIVFLGVPLVFIVIERKIQISSFILSASLVPIIMIFCFALKQHISQIKYIDKMTDRFDKFVVTAQIVSKVQESNTRVSGQQGYVSSRTSHTYMVGLRDISGSNFRINSSDLYMSSREGEYVDILVKQKLDKNNNVIDSSYIPIMETIRSTL